MKLILHHLAKDIRAQRWLLLLWAFIIVIQAVADLMILQPDYDVANLADKVRSSPLLGLIGGLLWIFLIVQLIQSEPVTGSASFWLTRPVPRWVYIPSKLLFIFLLLVLPSLLLTPLNMIELNTDTGLIWQNIKIGLFWQASFLIGVLWLATFTRSLAQFFLAVGLLIPISVILFGLREMDFLRSVSGDHSLLMVARGFIFTAVLFSGLIISLALQHGIRKTSTGMTVGIIATTIAVLAGFFWPFRLPSHLTLWMLPTSQSKSEKSAHADFASGWQNNVTWHKAADGDSFASGTSPMVADKNNLTARAPLTAVPTDEKGMVITENITASFQPNGGHLLTLPMKNFLDSDDPFDLKAAIQADVPDITIDSGTGTTSPSLSLFQLDPDTAGSLRGKSGTLSLAVYGHIDTFVRKAVIPLNGHAFAALPGEIVHVRRQDGETQTLFGIEIPTPGSKPVLAVWDITYKNAGFQLGPTTFYLLVDSQNHTGTILRQSNKFRLPLGFGLSSRSGWRDFLPLNGNEPIDRMVLYIYEFRQGGYFDTTLTAPNFVMNPP
jgi:hypothetical protein